MLIAGASSEAHRAASRTVNLDCQSVFVIVDEEEEDEDEEDNDEFDAFAPPAVEFFKLASSAPAAEATRETFAALVDFPGTAPARNVQSGLSASRTSLAAAVAVAEEEELDEEEGTLELELELELDASSPRATSDAAPRSSRISSSVTAPREASAEAHSATTEDDVAMVLGVCRGPAAVWEGEEVERVES